ncbi:MAG TPA: UDP-N-acetylmuramoyl-L-alanine--D-glutamate ligase [Solirubrobacteraceae bacterium]|nr:UDP-N-acetylmuramoyl-L-alanine--D-glutamate ligase [Solirubrobacteraceae bacterium]
MRAKLEAERAHPEIPGGPYLVVGLARSGIAAARVLCERGERVVGLDAGAPPAAAALSELGVELHLEQQDGTALLGDVRALVKSPGVPAQAPVIEAARERGMPVLGELELAWRLLGNEFIAVTGTNGKTTTVELIGHIYREAGMAVAVAGNVGTALSSLVGTLDTRATVVCEASSFQLEDTLAFAPEAAVLLNVTPDHLDRHGTIEAYAAAKLQAFARQGEDDVAVLPGGFDGRFTPGGAARRFEFGWDASADLFELDGELWWQGDPLISLAELSLRGRHNVENAMAAAAVCLARGLDAQAVRAGLASFAGVAHRLEEVAELDGVLYVNDSKATNVASTLVALEAFAGRPLHLILGGRGKGQDFTSLREPVQQRCAAVYLIGEAAPTIAAALTNVAPPVLDCGELERAVRAARAAMAGDSRTAATGLLAPDSGPVVLLSPACASFDQFADFEARGASFRELVEKLQG